MLQKYAGNPRRQVLAFCIAMAWMSAPAYALTLGGLQTHSFLGQPLYVKIVYRLAPDEAHPQAQCLKLSVTENGLPTVAQAVLRVAPEQWLIEVISSNAINEPLVAFTLHSNCSVLPYSRSYTVFLDPQPSIASAVEVHAISAPAIVEVLASPTPRPISSPAPKMRWPSKIKVENDSTVAEIAAIYYPPGSTRYRRLLNALIAANPKTVDQDGRVVAGTQLRSATPAKPKPAPTLAPQVQTEDKLTLLASEPEVRTQVPKIDTTPASYAAALQEKVDTMQHVQLKMETEITQLQATLAKLEVEKLALLKQASDAAAKAAQTKTNRTALPVFPGLEAMFWLILGAMISGIAGLSFWLGRRGRRHDGYAVRQGSAALFGKNSQVAMHPPVVAARYPVEDPLTIQRDPNTGFIVGEEESDIDRAQFLLADGEVDEAIRLLHKAIADNERDVERWLILFHIFRERTMKTEYAQLALRFMETTPEIEDWELVCHIGRKIDPNNELYIVKHREDAAKPSMTQAEEAALDFLSAEAAEHSKVERLDLELDRLEEEIPPRPGDVDFQAPDAGNIVPELPEENPPKDDDDQDDYAKPCRY